jgi:hypothetical protein
MRTDAPSQWFRMYAEFATDPKVQRLSETDQRRYIMLLCLRCSNGDVTLHDDDVTFQLRISNEEWAKTKAELVTRKLVTKDNKPTAWEKRQYRSDSSAERVAEHRKRNKQMSNVDVTLPLRPVEGEAEREAELTDTDVSVVASDAGNDLPADKKSDCPHQAIIDLYEKHLPMLPSVVAWEGQRKQNLKARWRWVMTAKKRNGAPYASNRMEALGFFDRYFAYVASSDFLTGRNGKWLSCDLGWLVKAENFAKVLQGNYAEKEAQA